MNVKGKLSGFEDFSQKLKDLGPRIEKRVLQKAVTTSLREIRKEVANAAPQDLKGQSAPSKKYGRGKRNIRVQRLRRTRRGEKGARIHTGNAFWLLFYELGTKFQPARPWFRPTFERLVDRLIDSLKTKIGDGIIDEAKKK